MTGPTRVQPDKVGLERARPVEGMAEVLEEALKHKNNPLGPFPMELPLTGAYQGAGGYGGTGAGCSSSSKGASVLVYISLYSQSLFLLRGIKFCLCQSGVSVKCGVGIPFMLAEVVTSDQHMAHSRRAKAPTHSHAHCHTHAKGAQPNRGLGRAAGP